MHYNSQNEHILTPRSYSSSFSLSDKDIINNNIDNPINLVDIFTINKYSHLKLTKNFKDALSLNPEFKIIVFQENFRNYNNHKKIILTFNTKIKLVPQQKKKKRILDPQNKQIQFL